MTDQGLTLQDGLRRVGLDYPDLWQRYAALGGNGTESDLRRHVASGACGDDHEHNLIAQAINEAFLEAGQDHPVAYHHLTRPGRVGSPGE